MKKFLPLFIAVMIIASLAVPAFASITPLYYEFYEGVQLPLYLYNPEYDEYINLRGNDFEDMNMLLVESSTYGHVLYGFSGDVLIDDAIPNNYKLTSSEVGEMHLHESGEYWVATEMHDEFSIWCTSYLKWSNFDLVAEDGKLILQADPLYYACDGSTCPATDANMDNVCDDCGMTFAVLRNYAPEGWPSSLPVPPSLDYMSYTVVEDADGTWLFMVGDEVPYVYFNFETTTLNFTMEGQYPGTNIQRYRLSGDEWAYNSIGSLRSQKLNGTYKFLYSSVDVYDLSGNPFFPEPLWLQVQGQTQGGVKNLAMTLGQTMAILVPFGVGLMALLVGLVLLAKKFRVFLP